MRYIPDGASGASGASVANFSVATSETWKDKASGEKQERTEWHRISAFGRLAEIVGEYVKKGSSVYIEGKIQTRKWQDKDGQDRYTTEIIADKLTMLGSPRGDTGEQRQPSDSQPAQRTERPKPAKTQGQGQFDDLDDDIPF